MGIQIGREGRAGVPLKRHDVLREPGVQLQQLSQRDGSLPRIVFPFGQRNARPFVKGGGEPVFNHGGNHRSPESLRAAVSVGRGRDGGGGFITLKRDPALMHHEHNGPGVQGRVGGCGFKLSMLDHRLGAAGGFRGT
mgnify:CR=1 FL=1